MAHLKKPIRIVKYTTLSKDWDRVVGFLAMWFQQEIGFTHQQYFTREMLLSAQACPSGHFYEVECQGSAGPELKIMGSRLHKALMEYNCLRSWRLPQNAEFFVGSVGKPFCPTDYKKYGLIMAAVGKQ